jgi:soluble lytic murein transglycosylase-like protein
MTLDKFQNQCAIWIQQIREAPGIHTMWLPVSYVMAHIQIESRFDPNVKASDYNTTGSVGLMQVTKSTARYMAKCYPLMHITKPQTDPYTSILTGMLDLYNAKQSLIRDFGEDVEYKYICMAYNEGAGNVIRGVADERYYNDWSAAQKGFVSLDIISKKT